MSDFPIIFSSTTLHGVCTRVNGMKERGEFDYFISTNRPFESCPNPEAFIRELGTNPKESSTLPIRLAKSSLYELRLGQAEEFVLRGQKIANARILFLILDPLEDILKRLAGENAE